MTRSHSAQSRTRARKLTSIETSDPLKVLEILGISPSSQTPKKSGDGTHRNDKYRPTAAWVAVS